MIERVRLNHMTIKRVKLDQRSDVLKQGGRVRDKHKRTRLGTIKQLGAEQSAVTWDQGITQFENNERLRPL